MQVNSAHWRRGFDGIIHAGVLQFYLRTVISDCWSSYFSLEFRFRHAICNGHIMRELVAAAFFRHQGWAVKMFDLLYEIYVVKREAVDKDENSLPAGYINDVRARFRQILENGFGENPGVTKGKTYALLERLRALEDAVLEFAVDFSVDFTNNSSEISIRDLKIALRVIGQFKTMQGLADYCIIQSFVDTCRKRKLNPYDMIRTLMHGGDVIETVFGAEETARIKPMIRLARAWGGYNDAGEGDDGEGDDGEITAAMAEMPMTLTDELLAAAEYGPYRVCDAPPPIIKNPSPAVPKDKMKAAREIISRNKSCATGSTGNGDVSQSNAKNTGIRAGPESA
jgi:hypothetical protein